MLFSQLTYAAVFSLNSETKVKTKKGWRKSSLLKESDSIYVLQADRIFYAPLSHIQTEKITNFCSHISTKSEPLISITDFELDGCPLIFAEDQWVSAGELQQAKLDALDLIPQIFHQKSFGCALTEPILKLIL